MPSGIKKIVISDNDEDLLFFCQKYLSNEGWHIITLPKNGQIVWDTIIKERPDVVICNIFMSHYNANTIMANLKSEEIFPLPTFMAISASDNDLTYNHFVNEGGVDVFIKPFDVRTVKERIERLFRDQEKLTKVTPVNFRTHCFWEEDLCHSLKRIGMPANLQGYKYIKVGLRLMFQFPERFTYSKRGLYQAIAQHCGSDYSRVERNIRNAIERAFSLGRPETFEELFGYSVNHLTGKPNNLQFIDTLYEYLSNRHRANRQKLS